MLARGEVHVLSYRWLSANAPDSKRFHLSKVREYIESPPRVNRALTGRDRFLAAGSGHLAGNGRPAGSRSSAEGIFWDYCSLPQKGVDGEERTAEQEATFKQVIVIVSVIVSLEQYL